MDIESRTFQTILALLVSISLIIIGMYFCIFLGLEDSSWISNLLFCSSILLFIMQVVIALYFLCKLKTFQNITTDTPYHHEYPRQHIPNYFLEKRSQPTIKEPIIAVTD